MTDRLRVGLMLFATLALAAAPAVSLAKQGSTSDDPDAAGALYGDLYVLERDGNGEPITIDVEYDDHGETVTVTCKQPIASDCTLIPLNWEKDDFDPELEDACGPQADYLEALQGVAFGRGSIVRSPAFVIDSAYAEFLATVNAASDVDRDPAGRIRLLIPPEDDPTGDLFWKTVDAPLANLGLYREVLTNGCLGTVTDEEVGEGGVVTEVTHALEGSGIDLLCGGTYPSCEATPLAGLLCDYPDYPSGVEWWTTPTPDAEGVTRSDMLLATAFIAGTTDKTSPLSLDEIININTYLGINTYTWSKVKKVRVLTVDYFRFEDPVGPGGWFAYDLGTDAFVDSTTAPLLGDWDGTPEDTTLVIEEAFPVFSSLEGVDFDSVTVTVCRDGAPQLDPSDDTLLVCDEQYDETYDPVGGTWGCGGANWFTQAAEFARKTVWFVHNWEVPVLAR